MSGHACHMHGPEKCSTDGSLETPLSSEQQQRHRSLSRELHQFASLCCCSMRIAHLCWRVDRRACCSCNLLRRRHLVPAAVPLRLSSVERRAKEHLRASTQQPGQGQLHRTMHTDPTDGSAAFAAGSVSRDRARHVPSRLSPSLCAKTYAGLFHVDREGVSCTGPEPSPHRIYLIAREIKAAEAEEAARRAASEPRRTRGGATF